MHRPCGRLGGRGFDGVLNSLPRFDTASGQRKLDKDTCADMPHETAEVIEIQGRSEQGMQEPFQCLADDGHLYYVKGCQTDRSSLCNELICAHLAVQLGLPLPPFKLLNVSEEILAEAPPAWRVLGAGLAFGSQQHPGCTWFDKAQVQHVPMDLQREIMAFDWWIRNLDRYDYNPNLLWDASNAKLVVIDHNLAFDNTFETIGFLENHIFRECWRGMDFVGLDALQLRFSHAMDAVLAPVCDNIPPSWHWANAECDIPANVDLDAIKATLARCKSHDFWRFA